MSDINSKTSETQLFQNCLLRTAINCASATGSHCGIKLQSVANARTEHYTAFSSENLSLDYNLEFIHRFLTVRSNIVKKVYTLSVEEYLNGQPLPFKELKTTVNEKSDFCLASPITDHNGNLLGFIYILKLSDSPHFSEAAQQLIVRHALLLESIINLAMNDLGILPSTDLKMTNQSNNNKQINFELKNTNQQLSEKVSQLEHSVQIDKLTGLYNRAYFEKKIDWLLGIAERNKQSLVVVLIDLDDFKVINDTLGHKAGDSLLVTIAERLNQCARKSDIVARLGGDEFVLIINNPSNKKVALDIVERVLANISSSMQLEHRTHTVSCSIGFSVYPDDADTAEDLLKYADSAMYQAKKKGKGKFQYYSESLQNEIQQHIQLEADLKQAIDKNQFVLYYQPQMDMRTGAMVGMEALIRWQHPTKGLTSPNDFIPLAEEIGLILPIGDWVISEACRQLSEWKIAGLFLTPISVNLSVKQLMQQNVAEHIQSILQQYNTPENLISIEITESISLEAAEKHFQILDSLKSIGLKISIDDFGTGYSNLNYLKRFPIDELKIDKSFVDDITTDPHDKAIATTIIGIAHNLNLKVVAEGIETKEQLAILAKNGCDILQGYYFSKPLTKESMTELIKESSQLNLDGIRPSDYTRRILIVDDEKNMLSSLQRLFRKEKFEVIIASSGAEALEKLALYEVGIVLSDLSMPEMNGVDLLQLVGQMYPYTIQMILSGQSEFESACDAINRSSIHKFVRKPWSDEALKRDIGEAFKLYEDQFY